MNVELTPETIRELSLDRLIMSPAAVYLWHVTRANKRHISLDSQPYVASRLGITREMVVKAEARLIDTGRLEKVATDRRLGVRVIT